MQRTSTSYNNLGGEEEKEKKKKRKRKRKLEELPGFKN